IYATDCNDASSILEPLITAGKVRPLIVVAAESGRYLGDQSANPHDIKKDLRAMEYLAGIDEERYAKHEKFFCEELIAWAERDFGASRDGHERAVFGCSNGARFAADMGVKRPDLFGHVFAFSVAGRREFKVPAEIKEPATFHLAAGTWEKGFHTTTSNTAA